MGPFSKEIYNVIKETYRKCFQVVVSPYYHNDLCDPTYFGSGFVLQVSDRDYFITASHVTASHNYPDFQSWGDDDNCGVVTGFNDEQNHVHYTVPLTGRYEYVMTQKPEDIDDLVFPEHIETTFCVAPKEIPDKCVTLGFRIPYSIFSFPAGMPKQKFHERDIMLLSNAKKHYFFVIGTIISVSESNGDACVKHRLHCSLCFNQISADQLVLKSYNSNNSLNNWSGLSGSPVVSDEGNLVGMLVEVNDKLNTIFVLPIENIVKEIKRIQSLERKGYDTSQPFIIVGPGVTIEDIEDNPALKEIISKIKK